MAAPSVANLQRTFFTLAILVLVLFCLAAAQTVLVPVALALLLAFILQPLVGWLERHAMRRLFAVILVVLLATVILGAVLWAVTAEVQNLAVQIPGHRENIDRKLAPLYGLIQQVKNVEKLGKEAQKGPPGQTEEPSRPKPIPVTVEETGSSVVSWVPTVARPIFEFLATLLLVIVLVLFILAKRETLMDRVIRLAGHGQVTSVTKALEDAAERVSRYLLMQLCTNSIVGGGVALALFFLGVPYAFLWGFLTTLLRFIPYLGIWIAAFLPFALSVAIFPNWTQPLVILATFVGLDAFMANIVEPMLFGHSTGVSEIALLVAAVFWTWLWGPIGLLLSTPLTVCLVVLGRHVPYLEFLAVLLGDQPVVEPAVRYYQRLLANDQDGASLIVEEFLKNHPHEQVYDQVLVPALCLAGRDREQGTLTPETQQFIFRATRDLLEDVLEPHEEISLIASGKVPVGAEGPEPPAPAFRLVGCPAHGEADELALLMLKHLLRPLRCEVDVLSSTLLIGEVVHRVGEQPPVLVCVASLPPGGLAQARSTCKRLRAKLPDLRSLVGRWGQTEDLDQTLEFLRRAGADQIATAMLQTRDQIAPLAHVTTPAPGDQEGSETPKGKHPAETVTGKGHS